MNINFGAKLNIDNSLYSKLKYSDSSEIIKRTSKIINLPKVDKLIGKDEITLSGKRCLKGDCVKIKYGDYSYELCNPKGEIKPNSVWYSILLHICHKNDKYPGVGKLDSVIDALNSIPVEN